MVYLSTIISLPVLASVSAVSAISADSGIRACLSAVAPNAALLIGDEAAKIRDDEWFPYAATPMPVCRAIILVGDTAQLPASNSTSKEKQSVRHPDTNHCLHSTD